MAFKDKFIKLKYWDDAGLIYSALGGKYKKASNSGMATPLDASRWAIARELASTNKRVCVKCGYTEGVKSPSEVKKHCGNLMAADLTAQDRKEIKASFGKLKVRKKIANSCSDEEDGSDSEDKEEKEAAMLKYTAKFIRDDENIGNCHWVVKQGSNPVLKLTLSQAYPGKESTKAAPFSNIKYGNMLIDSIENDGLDVVYNSHLHKRGTLITAQVNTTAPDIFQDDTGVEDQDMQGRSPQGQQADGGLIDESVGDDILEDKTDESNIVELVKEALVPVIVASGDEMTAEALVQELKSMFQNEQALNKFQGSLAEMVENSTANEKMEKDKEQEMIAPQPADTANVGAVSAPPPDQQPMASAAQKRIANLNGAIKKAESEIKSLNTRLSDSGEANKGLVDQLRQANKRVNELEGEKQNLLDQNKSLIADRTIRVRYPRCNRLARKMVETGEVDDAKSSINALLKMPTKEFMALESRVNKVHARLNIRSANNGFAGEKGLLGALPEQRDEGKKEASLLSGPRANSAEKIPVAGVNWS